MKTTLRINDTGGGFIYIYEEYFIRGMKLTKLLDSLKWKENNGSVYEML